MGFATSFDFLPAEISGLYLVKFPQTPLANQMLATSGAKRLRGRLLPLHLL